MRNLNMKRFAFAAGAFALVIGVGACSKNPTAARSSLLLTAGDTIAAMVTTAGSAVVNDLDVIGSAEATIGFQVSPAGVSGVSLSVTGSEVMAGFAPATGCTLNATSGRFECPPVTNNGLTLTRSFAFFNAAGQALSKWNDTTVASVNVTTTESGVRANTTGADTISGSRNMTVSGLAGHNTTRTWNGTGSRSVGGYFTDSAASRVYDHTENATFTNVLITIPRSTNPYPTSGSVSRQVTAAGTVTKGGKSKSFSATRTVTVTFNGTEFVPMMIGSTAYTLDLATGKATKN
jgi:hypothetical protein